MALNTAKWMFNRAYLSKDPSARVCATFGRRNGANEGETHVPLFCLSGGLAAISHVTSKKEENVQEMFYVVTT